MQLAELQAKTDQELFDFALEEELVEEGPLPKRMDILRKLFKFYTDREESFGSILDTRLTFNRFTYI